MGLKIFSILKLVSSQFSQYYGPGTYDDAYITDDSDLERSPYYRDAYGSGGSGLPDYDTYDAYPSRNLDYRTDYNDYRVYSIEFI